jgi:hypothetical protein
MGLERKSNTVPTPRMDSRRRRGLTRSTVQFAQSGRGVDTRFVAQLVSNLKKLGIVLMLLVLICGPLLQIYDCFNDPPALDHDALLHTVDALSCMIFVLILAGLLALVFALIRLVARPPDEQQSPPPLTASNLHLHALHSSPPPLRV